MFDGRKESSDPFEQSVYLLSVLARAAEDGIGERLAARGLDRVHQEVLTVLAQAGPHGRADLVRRIASPDAAAAVDALLARGLVQAMTVHVGGARQEVLMLSPDGQGELTAMHADAAAVQDALMVSFTRGDRAQLNALLRRMHVALGRREGFGSPQSVSRKVRGRDRA
ncbi:hypothetical protein ACFV1L_23255 [Kitasatospora sp. NPDC059646]|uniref:hypothetical protein n=1 Tax=Kitasatospora sp. NPDC059646 TaxID=3346893 RepID=UPI0036A60B00